MSSLENQIQENKRDSNLELFRIITMFLIIAHHYVVNSGLNDLNGPIVSNPFCLKSIFYCIFGAWGKTGINCFVFITGYFMCKSRITKNKFFKLLIQVYFYKITIYLIFLLSGYELFSIKNLIITLLPFSQIDKNFTGCFLIFYLFIPFLNILVNNLTKKQHELLLCLSLSVYVIIGTVLSVSFNYVTWFCILYFISSYIRLYPTPFFENNKIWFTVLIISIVLACSSIVALLWIAQNFNKYNPFFFVSDSNKIFAIITSFSAFLFFRNLKVKYDPFINSIASTCFGVLLIHANSDTMRKWLWQDMLHNVEMYNNKYFYFHALISVICLFIICSIIDLLRGKIFSFFGRMITEKRNKND